MARPSFAEPEFMRAALEAKMADHVSAFVFDHVGTFQTLEGGLGIFITERCGSWTPPT